MSAQESLLHSVSDPEVLGLVAAQGRVLVSHDRHTMIVSQNALIAEVVDALVVLWAVADQKDLLDQAFHVPSLMRHVFAPLQ